MVDAHELGAWVGRTSDATDIAAAAAVRRLAALLDHEQPPWAPGVLPPLGHWLYFLTEARQSALDADGHSRRGDFLPPIELSRRMWAGGRIEWLRDIALGEPIARRSIIAAVSPKRGASGELVFVTLRHEISTGSALALVEEQDLVFCGPVRPSARDRAADGRARRDDNEARPPEARRSIVLGPVELFRFSALTFNAHRIHYDRDYARDSEGYPGLVVHGPYLALLLIDQFLRLHPAAPLARLSYRAESPLFEAEAFDLCAREHAGGALLWAQRSAPGHAPSMRAEITSR